MKRADLKFRVTDESVQGTIQLQGEILHKGATKVPLTTGMAILDARQEGKGLPLALENGTHTAVLNGPSEFSVTLDAGLPLNIEAGRASFSLPAPPAGSVRLALTVPGDHTNVRVSPGLIPLRSSGNRETSIEATLAPGAQANIWWTTREAAAPVVPKEVRFLSDVKTLVSVSEAEIRIAALADISVVQGEPAQFEIEIPSGYEVTGTTGASIESTAKEAGGLKRMDFKETNPYLRSLSRFPMQAAFRYHKQPSEKPSLALEWTRFPDSSVLSAVVELAVVTTLVTTEGRSLTEIKLLVKNQAEPFLKIALPAGASILTAEVAGEKVKPVEGPDGNRVPLLRPGFRPTDSYNVSFVFIHSGAPFAKKGGSDISLPKMDIPIDLLQWEVFLPEQYKVKDFGGDAIAANLLPPASQDVSGAESESDVTGIPGGAPIINYETIALLPGQLGGILVDSSGTAISNAQITVTQTENGIAHK